MMIVYNDKLLVRAELEEKLCEILLNIDVLDDIDMDWSCYANDTCTLCLINGTPTKCMMKCLSDDFR